MKKKELSENLKKVNFAHLYIDSLALTYLESYKELFLSYQSFDFREKTIDLSSFDIIFLELQTLNKENFRLLNKVVKENCSKDIYIFSQDCDNPFLLKFALHFSLNKISSLQSTDEEMDKLLVESSQKCLSHHADAMQLEISKKINSLFSILLLKNNALIFANDKAKKLFNTDTIAYIESVVKNDEGIYSLIQSDKSDSVDVFLENDKQETWNYVFYCDMIKGSDEKLITILPLGQVEEEDAFLATINRFKFIELLKDRLVQNSISQTPMSLVCVTIGNYDKLIESSGSIVVHEFLKKFITKLCFYKNSCQDLAQWSPHFFLFLIEGEEFENVKKELDSMHQKLIYSEIDKMISPVITSAALQIDKLEVNDIIDSIEQIGSRSYTCDDFNKTDYFELNHFSDYMDESEQIRNYFQSCIGNKTEIKLLNIYKGLCINTASKILKIKDNTYFVHCENLQGYSMQFEHKTVIQAPDLPKDIQADIVYVNLKESYAILDNLVFLNASANNRQHTRVQPSIRMPITIKYGRYSYQGEVMDLSTQSVSLKLNHSIDAELVSKKVEVKFKLPNSSSEEGFSYLDVDGKVVYVKEIGMTKSKVVVMLELEKPYDSYLLKYMYDRQKELIIELKKLIKLNNK